MLISLRGGVGEGRRVGGSEATGPVGRSEVYKYYADAQDGGGGGGKDSIMGA